MSAATESKAIPMAEYLELPAGWIATEFPTTIEMTGPNGERACLPKPYNQMSKEQWLEAAKEAVKNCRTKAQTNG